VRYLPQIKENTIRAKSLQFPVQDRPKTSDEGFARDACAQSLEARTLSVYFFLDGWR
jgi:hypothetical protein